LLLIGPLLAGKLDRVAPQGNHHTRATVFHFPPPSRPSELKQYIEDIHHLAVAAGRGRPVHLHHLHSLELQVDINDLAEMDLGAEGKQVISSMCTVFAESEVVSLIADGAPVNEIVMGLNRAIASRILSLVKRTTLGYGEMKIAMSGGVARNAGVVRAISALMDCAVSVPPDPDTVGALGAALIAKEKYAAKRQAAAV